MAVETPNLVNAAGLFAPMVPSGPFTENMISSKGVRSFTRSAVGQYIVELELPIAFDEGYAIALLPPNVQGIANAQVLPDATIFIACLTLGTGVPFDPLWLGLEVIRWNEGQGSSVAVAQPPIPTPIAPGGGGNLQQAYDATPNATIILSSNRPLFVTSLTALTPAGRLLIADDYLAIPGNNVAALFGGAAGLYLATDPGAPPDPGPAMQSGPIVVGTGQGQAGSLTNPDGSQSGTISLATAGGGNSLAASTGAQSGLISITTGNGGSSETGDGGNAGALQLGTGTGGLSSADGAGGVGGSISIGAGPGGATMAGIAGQGGEFVLGTGVGGVATLAGQPGAGGGILLFTGAGGATAGGVGQQGGPIELRPGHGSNNSSAISGSAGPGGPLFFVAGEAGETAFGPGSVGGDVQIIGGGGGLTTGADVGGRGGNVLIGSGAGGFSQDFNGGDGGNILISAGPGGASGSASPGGRGQVEIDADGGYLLLQRGATFSAIFSGLDPCGWVHEGSFRTPQRTAVPDEAHTLTLQLRSGGAWFADITGSSVVVDFEINDVAVGPQLGASGWLLIKHGAGETVTSWSAGAPAQGAGGAIALSPGAATDLVEWVIMDEGAGPCVYLNVQALAYAPV